MGTGAEAIDRAEDRRLFKQMLNKLGLKQPPNDTATSVEQALEIAHSITYPVLVRPSYVLGGRAMQIVSNDEALINFMKWALEASPDHPILIDKFLEDAIEVDVDAICDGKITVIGGIMEHIEEAGIHSGDSACVLPPFTLTRSVQEEIKTQTRALAAELGVIGLLNIQFAVKGDQIYVLEVNPRASRTVPFVSKATGVSLAKLATKVMLGHSLAELGFTQEIEPPYFAVKESVFPFRRFPGVDPHLRPGDALHRRSHGAGRRLRPGLCQVPTGRRPGRAAKRRRHLQRQGRGQAPGRHPGPGLSRPRASSSMPPAAPPTFFREHELAGHGSL